MRWSTSRRFLKDLALACAFWVACGVCQENSAPQSYNFPSKEALIAYLSGTIDWYRNSSPQQQVITEPADFLFSQDSQALRTQIVQRSFDYARADAALQAAGAAASQNPASADDVIRNLALPDIQHFVGIQKAFVAEATRAQADLEALKKKLPSVHAADRKRVEAAIAENESRLDLLQTQAKEVQNLVDFVRMTGDGKSRDGDLSSVIEDLARAVPEISAGSKANSPLSPMLTAPSSAFKSPDAGILGLISAVSAFNRELRSLDETAGLTDRLIQSSRSLRLPLAHFVTSTLEGSDLQSVNVQASDLDTLRQQKLRIDLLSVKVTSLSPALVALDEQRILLGEYQSHLASWRESVVSRYTAAWKRLIWHLAILASVLALIVAVAITVRRFTVRYVQDASRRRMILMTQQLMLWIGIALTIAVTFASDISSLATFLGLLTAGMAVALQNVILAALGYFLLVGKLGIRVGDQVQISGVTGELIELGLLQFQVREMDAEQKPTGRIASFSNSFVFVSPATGMFKVGPPPTQGRQ